MTDLPDTWADEPWPLDDPVPAPGLRPTNWSDTHTDPPQVADLADEAWQYAMDHGVSMEVALARLQDRKLTRRTGGFIPGPARVWIGDEEITVKSFSVNFDHVPKRWPKSDDQWIWSAPEDDDE